MQIIEMIYAKSRNDIIGADNVLPWNGFKEDIRHFRDTILDKTLIVGRKTYETLPVSIKAGSSNPVIIVVSKTLTQFPLFNNEAGHVKIARSFEEALLIAKQVNSKGTIVAGGKQIYDMFMPIVHRVYATTIPVHCIGDTVAPVLRDDLVPNTPRYLADGSVVDVYEDINMLQHEAFKTSRWR